MLRATFAADPLDYRAWAGEAAAYNAWLIDPPRQYVEALRHFLAVFTIDEPNQYAQYTLGAMIALDTAYWPSWAYCIEKFDPVGGRYLGRIPLSVFSTYIRMQRSADDLYWALNTYDNSIVRMDPSSWATLGAAYPVTHWYGTTTTIKAALVHASRDRAILYAPGPNGIGVVSVHVLSSGELIRKIPVCGPPRNIVAQDGTKILVISDDGVISQIDYETGQRLAVMSQPATLPCAVGWDRYARRLMLGEETDDNEDGSATAHIKGFFPIAVPIGLGQLMPLKMPSVGSETECIARVHAGADEAISGIRISMTSIAGATVRQDWAVSDRDGYGHFMVTPAAPDYGDIDAEKMRLVLSWQQANSYDQDAGGISIDLLDVQGVIVASLAMDASEVVPTQTWTPRSAELNIPAGARSARIRLHCVRHAGTICNACFDALHAQLLPRAGETADVVDCEIRNPDAETLLAEWTVESGAWFVDSGNMAPFEGDYYFEGGAYSTNVLGQTFDLIPIRIVADLEIDA